MNRIEALRGYCCAIMDDPGWAPVGDYICTPSKLDIHHQTGAGMALKSSDERTFPLCHRHHMDFHDHTGIFRTWDKERRRAWQDAMVERYDRILCDPEAF